MDIKVDNNTVIVFDLDDTLYNEIEYLKSAYKFIANQLDSTDKKLLYRNMFAMYRKGENVFQYLVDKYNIEMSDLITLYRNHTPDIYLFDGLTEILELIIQKKGKLAIITDGRVKTQLAKLKALGIEDYFSKVVISEAIGTEKPNQQNFSVVEEDLPAAEYYYIGDNIKKDFVSPNLMGWRTIGLIDNGLNIHYETSDNVKEGFMPHYLITSYKEINII